MDRPPLDRCHECFYFHRGYRVYGSRVPSSCSRHFHTIHGDDPACPEYVMKSEEDDHDQHND